MLGDERQWSLVEETVEEEVATAARADLEDGIGPEQLFAELPAPK